MAQSNALKIVSIVLGLIGGSISSLFGFSLLNPCNFGWIGYGVLDCVFFLYIGGVGLFAIVGSLIEFKSLIVGSIICLISGVLGIMFAVIITMTLAYPNLFLVLFFIPIVGGHLVFGVFCNKKINNRTKNT